MCGIVGFTGNRQAAPILLEGLAKLEYRGYDSAGLAVRDGEKFAEVVKSKGRLSNLIEKREPVALGIHVGQHMASRARQMHIRMCLETARDPDLER